MASSVEYISYDDNYTDYSYDYDEIEYRCSAFVELTYFNVIVYLSFIFGLLLHIFITFRLCTRVTKKRAYHYFIIVQSIVDGIRLSYGPVIFNSGCFIFHIPIDDFITPSLDSIQLIFCVFLTVYWKSAIHPQRWVDRSLFGIPLVSILGIVVFDVFQIISTEDYEISVQIKLYPVYLTAIILVTAVCAASYLLVMRMDVSRFSEVTLKGQKKLASILFYQLLCIQSCHLLGSILSIFDVYQLYVYNTEGLDAVLILSDKYGDTASVLGDISTIWADILPVIRGILMCWAIKPLLQTKIITIVTRSTTSTTQRS